MQIMPTTTRPLQVPPMAMPKGAPLSYGMAQSNVGGAPIAPSPMVGPNLPASPTPQPINFTPPTIGAAPTSTPYGTFTPPTPGALSKYGQFRLDQGLKARERGAAAHGTLLSGGFQQAMERYAQGVASEEAQNDYNRALSAYGANRDTNQQNFGQSLASYNAGTGAALDAGRLGLAGETATYDRNYGAQRDAYGDARDAAQTQAGVINTNQQASDAYQRQMADYNAALQAQRQADMVRFNAQAEAGRGTLGSYNQDDTARQNAATTAAMGTMPTRRPLPGAPPRFGRHR